MSFRTFTVGVAALVCAAPAAAQQRGTIEFGGFASAATFDNQISLKTGYGGGGRIGAYLDPRWSIEFEDAEMRATRPNGLLDVNVGILSGRLVGVPVKSGKVSLLLGVGGGVSTETNFLHSYGVDVLAGIKYAVSDNVAFRVDGVLDWLEVEDLKTYKSVRVGFSLYRRPARETITHTVTVTTPAPAPVMIASADSVSAAETRRLRQRDAALAALRDSLNNAPRTRMMTSEGDVATMQAQIHFAFDKSVLTDSAKAILDDKVVVFRAHPEMTILLVGYTDVRGTDSYNMALGTRRARAAKAYLVAHGITADRVLLESEGERQQIPNSAGVAGEAPNRRAVFRLLIVPDVKP